MAEISSLEKAAREMLSGLKRRDQAALFAAKTPQPKKQLELQRASDALEKAKAEFFAQPRPSATVPRPQAPGATKPIAGAAARQTAASKPAAATSEAGATSIWERVRAFLVR